MYNIHECYTNTDFLFCFEDFLCQKRNVTEFDADVTGIDVTFQRSCHNNYSGVLQIQKDEGCDAYLSWLGRRRLSCGNIACQLGQKPQAAAADTSQKGRRVSRKNLSGSA